MRLERHIIISTVTSAAVFAITKSFPITIASFLSGIFIDIDHLLDYFLHEKKIRLDIRDFFYKCDNFKLSKIFLLLHSYEFIFIIAIFYFFFMNKILLGIMIGFSIHLFFDLIGNATYIKSYMFFYRLKHNFNPKKIFKKAND